MLAVQRRFLLDALNFAMKNMVQQSETTHSQLVELRHEHQDELILTTFCGKRYNVNEAYEARMPVLAGRDDARLGVVNVKAKDLRDVLRDDKAGSMQLSCDSSSLIIETDRVHRVKIEPYMKLGDIPMVQDMRDIHSLPVPLHHMRVDAQTLAAIYKQNKHCSHNKKTVLREYTADMLWLIDGSKLCIAATDGRHMVENKTSCAVPASGKAPYACDTHRLAVSIPAVCILQLLMKVREDEVADIKVHEKVIEICFREKRIVADTASRSEWPPHEQVITSDTYALIERQALLAAMTEAAEVLKGAYGSKWKEEMTKFVLIHNEDDDAWRLRSIDHIHESEPICISLSSIETPSPAMRQVKLYIDGLLDILPHVESDVITLGLNSMDSNKDLLTIQGATTRIAASTFKEAVPDFAEDWKEETA